MTGFTRAVAALALVVSPILIATFYSLFGQAAGLSMRIRDMDGDFVSGILAALGVLLVLQIIPLPVRHRAILTALWLIRAAVTLGLMLFYESYYAVLDAKHYYHEALFLSDPWALVAYGDGTENIIALTSVLAEFSQSYAVFKVLYAAIGLAGVYLSYRAVILALGRESHGMLFILGLMPSILFWTSILGKEPIVSLGIALICIGTVGYFERRNAAYLLVFAAGALIAGFIRMWLLIIFLTPFLATLFLSSRSPAWTKVALGILSVPLFLMAMQTFSDRFQIETAQDLLARSNEIAKNFSTGGSAQKLDSSFDSLGGMIAFLPLGIFTALFRPLPGEVNNPFGILAGLENAGILFLLIYGVWRRGVRPFTVEPILIWAVLTLLAWAAVYGFVSYYNLGTGFRFRQMVTPIMVSLGVWAAFGPAWRAPGSAGIRAARTA
ncbi:MAG: hypothetical protein AAFU49_08535 [Pseudomonadota bacterium]